MPDCGARPTAHEVLAAVLQIRGGTLQVLAWRRAQPPDAGRWALPGGLLGDDEDVVASVRRQLTEKVDVREVAHVEQLAVFSDPRRVPGGRRRAKLSYTNLGFALAPREFTISTLREHYAAALGHPVSATNLQRVLARRSVLVPTGALATPGPAGGRPAALFRFAEPTLRVTDAFAVLRPPGEQTRAALP